MRKTIVVLILGVVLLPLSAVFPQTTHTQAFGGETQDNRSIGPQTVMLAQLIFDLSENPLLDNLQNASLVLIQIGNNVLRGNFDAAYTQSDQTLDQVNQLLLQGPASSYETSLAISLMREHLQEFKFQIDILRNDDSDRDGVRDGYDNCPISNADQRNTDGDIFGDACDLCPDERGSNQLYTALMNGGCPDVDDDGIRDTEDNCPETSNADQTDLDGNGVGDACQNMSLYTLGGHDYYAGVSSVAFSPDGRFLASGDWDGIVNLWDPASGDLVRTLEKAYGHRALAFSPDSRMLASAVQDAVKLYDVDTGEVIRTLAAENQSVDSLAFSPDGALLLGSGQEVLLWDVETGERLNRTFANSRGQSVRNIEGVAFSPDGLLVFAGSLDDNVWIWDVESGEIVHALEHPDDVNAIALSPDGTLLASLLTGKIWLWDMTSDEPDHIEIEYDGSLALTLAFSPDGSLLAGASHGTSANLDSAALVWDVASGELVYVLIGHSKTIECVAFSPDGTMLASASGDQTVRLWDVTR